MLKMLRFGTGDTLETSKSVTPEAIVCVDLFGEELLALVLWLRCNRLDVRSGFMAAIKKPVYVGSADLVRRNFG